MYLINYLSLQTAQQLFIAVGRFRTGVALVGPKDGINHEFFLPGAEKFTHNLPYLTIAIYLNGMRQTLLDDYLIFESMGPGTGYDKIVMERAPHADDKLLADCVTL